MKDISRVQIYRAPTGDNIAFFQRNGRNNFRRLTPASLRRIQAKLYNLAKDGRIRVLPFFTDDLGYQVNFE